MWIPLAIIAGFFLLKDKKDCTCQGLPGCGCDGNGSAAAPYYPNPGVVGPGMPSYTQPGNIPYTSNGQQPSIGQMVDGLITIGTGVYNYWQSDKR